MAEERVTRAGVYVERESSAVNVTRAGVYIELNQNKVVVTRAGVYVELEALPATGSPLLQLMQQYSLRGGVL